MAKSKTNATKPLNQTEQSGINYAYKPKNIGVVIKNMVIEQRLDEQELADKLKITVRSLQRRYSYEYWGMEELSDISPLLGENLLLLYHPNMKPKPDPSIEKDKEIKALREENTMLEDESKKDKIKIKALEKVIEELEKIVLEAMKKKAS